MSQFRRKLLESYATNKLVYPGLIAAWSAKGKTNEDVDRNVLKDLTGNGHDITLNNFAYSGMSGYGGYVLSIPEIKHSGDHVLYNNYMKFKIVSATIGKQGLIFRWNGKIKRNTFKLKVKYNKTNCKLYFGKAFSIGDDKTTSILLKDGINEIPYFTWSETETNWEGIMAVDDSNSELPVNTPLDVDVEFLPKYPDALVFDGVDDYGVNENMPILTDYTILVKRKYIGDITKRNYSTLIAKTNGEELSGYRDSIGLFAMECKTVNGSETRTFGMQNRVNYVATNITWQKRYNYNGISLKSYSDQLDSNHIGLGAIFNENKAPYRLANFAFYSAYLFDRSLDDQEIKSFIRKHIDPEYLLPSEIPAITLISNDTLIDNSTLIKNN